MKSDYNDELIFEYMLKIPKLKNDLITGEDSFNYSEKAYNDIMQNFQNQICDAKMRIFDSKELDNKINYLLFKKNELKIERIIHKKKIAKKNGENIFLYDQKLVQLITAQNKLLSLINF